MCDLGTFELLSSFRFVDSCLGSTNFPEVFILENINKNLKIEDLI